LALLTGCLAATADHRRSGFEDMGTATQALQRDDAQNPAWLWLKDGEQRFAQKCTGCHTAASLEGVAARYPAFDTAMGKALTLAGRINRCHERHLRVSPLKSGSDELLGLESYIAWLSRGLPLAPPADPRLAAGRAWGARLYTQRMGQLDLSCAQCHDQQAGRRLAGALIPQGHPTAYPIYRLEWQGMGSLQRRLRGCMAGVRAEPFAEDSDAFTALELHLKQRAAGMLVESPGVRP
jgi:sulfur-oxidizing protein SoxA